MENRLPHTIAADCGCSLTACHDGIVQSPDPRSHLQTNVEQVMQEYSMTEAERIGFCRMLDLKDHLWPDGRRLDDILPDRWQYIFKHVIRQVPSTSVDEKAHIYRLLGLGDPPAEERDLWAARNKAANFSMPDAQIISAPGAASPLPTYPPGPQWVSDVSCRDNSGDSAQGNVSLYDFQRFLGISNYHEAPSSYDELQIQRHGTFQDYSQT